MVFPFIVLCALVTVWAVLMLNAPVRAVEDRPIVVPVCPSGGYGMDQVR